MPRFEVEQMENWADYVDAADPIEAARIVARVYHSGSLTFSPLDMKCSDRSWFDILDDNGVTIDTYIVQEVDLSDEGEVTT